MGLFSLLLVCSILSISTGVSVQNHSALSLVSAGPDGALDSGSSRETGQQAKPGEDGGSPPGTKGILGAETQKIPKTKPVGSSTPLSCDPRVVNDKGNHYKETLSWVFSSTTFFKCADEISTKLKEIFAAGAMGESVRKKATEDGVTDLCPVFVELASIVTLSPLELRSSICEQNALHTTEIEEGDICDKMELKRTVNEGHYESLGYLPSVAEVFRTLTEMKEVDCRDMCGGEYKSILCSAFYSLANVVAILQPRKRPVPPSSGHAGTTVKNNETPHSAGHSK